MRNFNLSIGTFSNLKLGRLESILHPKIGSIIYNFYGGDVLPNKNIIERSWGNFLIEDTYSLHTDNNDFLKAEINIGDIVQFNPSGSSTIIYEKASKSNAFFLTERCNSRCIMCPQPPRKQGDFVDLSIATADLIKDENFTIGITGGEPTIAWDGLIKLLSVLNSRHPESKVELLTNARKFHNYENVKELSETIKDRIIVCIPLYSDIHNVHDSIVGVKGAFWETVQGIYNLERFKIPVELRIVLLKQNFKRLNAWAEYVYRHFPFVRHIAIMGLEPVGNAIINIDTIWVDPLDYSKQLLSAVKTFYRRGMHVSLYNHQLCTIPQSLWGYSKKSISEWKNSFFYECANCKIKNSCGGFFNSASFKHSRGILPIIF